MPRSDPPDHQASSTGPRPSGWPKRSPSDYDLYLVQMRRVWHPPTDVYETDQHIVVKVEIAGMNEDDFDISLTQQHLIVKGVRPAQPQQVVYQNMEIHYGQFRTEVEINLPLDRSSIDARYEDGFLFVTLRKAEQRAIPVHIMKSASEKS